MKTHVPSVEHPLQSVLLEVRLQRGWQGWKWRDRKTVVIGPELSLLKAGFGLACFLADASSTVEGAQVRGHEPWKRTW